jgi:hypothetical protein
MQLSWSDEFADSVRAPALVGGPDLCGFCCLELLLFIADRDVRLTDVIETLAGGLQLQDSADHGDFCRLVSRNERPFSFPILECTPFCELLTDSQPAITPTSIEVILNRILAHLYRARSGNIKLIQTQHLS